jgi:amino acid permease
MSQKT